MTRRHAPEATAVRDAALDALRREQDAIGALCPDALVVLRAGEPCYANPAFGRLTGMDRDSARELDEARFDALCARLADPARPPAALATLYPEGSDTLHLVRPKDSELRRSVRVVTVPGASPRIAIHLRDVTGERKGDRMPGEFLSLAAHELRTPIWSIFGFSELLLAREFDEATRRDLLSTIHRQASLLVNMVTNILDLARIEARAGRDFRIEPRPLAPIVLAAIEELRRARDKVRIRFDAHSAALTANVDGDRLVQAIRNVLDNACRYSPGTAPVDVALVAADDDGRPMAGIVVRDSGIGLTRDQAARIFDRFYRADPSGPVPGTGLGMSFVKEVVDLMHGRVVVAGGPGQGTEVTLWLPAAPAAPAAGARKPGGRPRNRRR